jgi:hypothetical protein
LTIKNRELKHKLFEFRFSSWAVFLATFVVVLINLTTVVFPALLMGTLTGTKFPVTINLFETGVWTYPLLVSNFMIFAIMILYFKNKLPSLIKKSIKFILNFEISKEVTFLVITILLGTYIALSVGEIFIVDPWPDFNRYIKPALDSWALDRWTLGVGTDIDFELTVEYPYFTLLLGILSLNVFGNYTTIPFIASISLLILTYLVTVEISKKRFAGIVAMVIVLQSQIFLIYDTTITYANFWVVFYLFSIYMIYKKWPLSSFSYLLSIISKTFTATFLPMTLFFIFRSNIPRQKKIRLLITYGIIAVVGIAAFVIIGVGFQAAPEFSYHKFLAGFTAFSSQFRFDGLIIMLLLPLTVGLFIVSRNGVKDADSILFMFLGMFLIAVLLPSITHFTNNPYRWVPFVVFFGIGVGTLLSKRVTKSI